MCVYVCMYVSIHVSIYVCMCRCMHAGIGDGDGFFCSMMIVMIHYVFPHCNGTINQQHTITVIDVL